MKKRNIFFFLGLLCLVGRVEYTSAQKVAHPDSLQFGVSTPDPASPESSGEGTVVIIGELKRMNIVEEVDIRFWPHYLNDRANIPAPESTTITTSRGHPLSGNIGPITTFHWSRQELSFPGLVSIKANGPYFMDKYLVMPGDSVRVLFDLDEGKTLFAGPSAKKFQCQFELNLAFETWQYWQDPYIPANKVEDIISTERSQEKWGQLVEENSPLIRKMKILLPDLSRVEYMRNLLEEAVDDHPGWAVLEKYYGDLDDEFLELMKAQLIGSILKRKMFVFNRLFFDDPDFTALLDSHILPFPEDHVDKKTMMYSPAYLDYLFEKNTLVSAIKGKRATDLYVTYPSTIQDLLYGRFLVSYYRSFEDSNEQFEKGLGIVDTPWIRKSIESLYEAQKIGQWVADFPLEDMAGNEVKLTDLKGKTLLVDFWFTGCGACVNYYSHYLSKVEEYFENDEDFLVVSISSDKDPGKWTKSINSGKYTSSKSLNLHAGGSDHPFIRYYNIQSYPTQMLINNKGEVIKIGDFPYDLDQLIKMLEFYKSH